MNHINLKLPCHDTFVLSPFLVLTTKVMNLDYSNSELVGMWSIKAVGMWCMRSVCGWYCGQYVLDKGGWYCTWYVFDKCGGYVVGIVVSMWSIFGW